MKNLKRSLGYIVVAFLVIFFVGCSQKSTEPLEPIGDQFKFEKITLNFKQKHFPEENKYQSKEDIEKNLNEKILKNLEINNLLNNNSDEELVIFIDFKRVFWGEDSPLSFLFSVTMGYPILGYDIKIVKNGKILRNLSKKNLTLVQGSGERENREVGVEEALGREIVKQIKNFKHNTEE